MMTPLHQALSEMDKLGPYSIPQMQDAANELANEHVIPPTRVLRADTFCEHTPEEQLAAVEEGPVILLLRRTPTFGHFIMLHLRDKNNPTVELFDPAGWFPKKHRRHLPISESPVWRQYTQDPKGLNAGGLLPVLRLADRRGYKPSFNAAGLQPRKTDSCGPHCLLRTALPSSEPEEYVRGVN